MRFFKRKVAANCHFKVRFVFKKKSGSKLHFEGGDSFWSSTHWRHWRRREEKHAATRREWLQQKTVQVCPLLLSMFLSLFDFSTWLSFRFNIFYIVDWCGRKGLLRLLCWSWFLLFIMLSFIFRSSLISYWFQDAIYISMNIMITNSFVCWIWLLVIVCLSHLFKARWFEIWNAALPSSFCSYFIFIFIYFFLSSPPGSIPFSFRHIPLFSSFIFLSGDPPWSFLLDKFNTADVGACLKRHIDPPFFKVESMSSGIVKSQA